MSVIKKKKHVSKKNKKAWRKYCDIADVEEFLEDQRLEERLGKFDIKPDSELFVVDTAGEDKVEIKDEKPLTAKQRKRQKLAEAPTPKCFEVLLSTSKVQDPNAKRNIVNPVGTKPTSLSKITDKRRYAKNAYEKKLNLAKKNRRLAWERKEKQKGKNVKEAAIDLWGDAILESKGIPESLVDDFISTEAQLHNVLPERRLRSKPPLSNTVVTRAAMEVPHPGVSYNPSYQEHQDLMQDVVKHEEKMMKKEAHILRVTSGMFRKVTTEQKENEWRKEMSAGLTELQDSSAKKEEEDPASDNEYRAINPPVKNKKKDHKARRKQKERLEELEKRKREKIDKRKITDIYRLRKIETSLTKKQQRQALEREQRKAKRALKAAVEPPSLNKNKTPRKEPDFVEPDSLTGDLRHINSKTNLLRERYESLQRRGALAAAKLMMKKKRKVKSYFKSGHKVTEQDVDRYMAKVAAKKEKKVE